MKRILIGLICLFLCNVPFAASQTSTPKWMSALSFGGAASDGGFAVKTDATGNRYITGYFSSTATFGTGAVVSAGGTDIFVAKFSPNGKLLWLVRAGGAGDDQGNDIDLDSSGNAYVTGWFKSSASFVSAGGGSTVATGSGETIFVAKYSRTGALVWVRTGLGSYTGINRGHALAVEPNTGTFYVTGIAQGGLSFSSSDGALHTVPGAGWWHMFLVKYDAAGSFQWGEWNQSAGNGMGRKVAIDADNSAYVTGWLEGSTTFHSHDGNDQTVAGLSPRIQTADYPGDGYLAKYDSNGNVKWVNQVGGHVAHGAGVATSADGRVTMTGDVGNIRWSTPVEMVTIVTSQPPGATINLGGGQYTYRANPDIFVATFDLDGVLLSASRMGGAQREAGSAVTYHGSDLYVTGIFQGDLTVDGILLTGNETANVFVIKYGLHGAEWAKRALRAGLPEAQVTPGMTVTDTGSVWLIGSYRGSAQFGTITLQSAGMEDIFFAKLQ